MPVAFTGQVVILHFFILGRKGPSYYHLGGRSVALTGIETTEAHQVMCDYIKFRGLVIFSVSLRIY